VDLDLDQSGFDDFVDPDSESGSKSMGKKNEDKNALFKLFKHRYKVGNCGELPHPVYSPAVFPTLKRCDTTPRTLRGKTLSSDSIEFPARDSELYLDITAAFILKVREESRPSLLALLERGRDD
jgi:hypothetical protein